MVWDRGEGSKNADPNGKCVSAGILRQISYFIDQKLIWGKFKISTAQTKNKQIGKNVTKTSNDHSSAFLIKL